MYRYNNVDQALVDQRVDEFRDQTARYLKGELPDEVFLQLRLRNGLYIQKHAPMLRIAVPYGIFSSAQARKLADIAKRYDRGYLHVTTRQNFQLNWPKLEEVPDILAELATVQMHAIQTSGNVVRNTTCDPFSAIAHDEVADARPYCELVRQWSTFHPEHNWLPRKFKIAFTGRRTDEAATAVHDIGVKVVRADGELGFQIVVGGGLGRSPYVGKVIREFLPEAHLLSYLEAILRVYNRAGDRQKKYKARIKITVERLGIAQFRARTEAEFERIKGGAFHLSRETLDEVRSHFEDPPFKRFVSAESEPGPARVLSDSEPVLADPEVQRRFSRWKARNTRPHKVRGYRAVFVSLKGGGRAPGDITSEELALVADLADGYSFGEIRSTHLQNLLLPHVEGHKLVELWLALDEHGLARPNIGTVNDLISCPGLDYCNLANAPSIPVALELQSRFDDLDRIYDLGDLQVKMSGCINACGHHHVGHIGILGVDKKGEPWYQVQLGGASGDDDAGASLGEYVGPAIARDRVVDAVEMILERYVEIRQGSERFIDTYRRVGTAPFHEAVYVPDEVGGRLCVRS